MALEFVGPLTVALLGSRRRLDLLWVALAAVGIVVLTRGGANALDGLGVALALLAGASGAPTSSSTPGSGRSSRAAPAWRWGCASGRSPLAPLGIAEGGAELLDGESLLAGAAVGLLSSVIPYSFEVEALRRIAPPVFGVLMSLEPGVAALAGFVVVGQPISVRVLVGIALVLGRLGGGHVERAQQSVRAVAVRPFSAGVWAVSRGEGAAARPACCRQGP